MYLQSVIKSLENYYLCWNFECAPPEEYVLTRYFYACTQEGTINGIIMLQYRNQECINKISQLIFESRRYNLCTTEIAEYTMNPTIGTSEFHCVFEAAKCQPVGQKASREKKSGTGIF